MDDNQPCTGCGLEEPIFLHHFPNRYHGTYEILCTNCVLNNHLTEYCIICFSRFPVETATSNQLHAPAHDHNSHTTCRDCPAKVHLACVPRSAPSTSSETSYLCPRCSSPSSFKFFDVTYFQENSLTKDLSLFNKVHCASMIAVLALPRVHEAIRARQEGLARQESEEATERVIATTEKYLNLREELLARENRDGTVEDGNQNVAAAGDAGQGLDDDDDYNASDDEQEQQQLAEDMDADNDEGDDAGEVEDLVGDNFVDDDDADEDDGASSTA